MRKSSRLFHWIEGLSGAQHCPQDGDAATGKSDDRLGMVFTFAPFAVVEGLGQRMFRGDGAEGALEEDALERLVSAEGSAPSRRLAGLTDDRCQAGGAGERVGRGEAADVADASDELCRQHCPHPRQSADEGAVKVAVEQRLQVEFDAGECLAGLKSFGGEYADHVGEDGFAGNDDALAMSGFERASNEGLDAVKMRRFLQMRDELLDAGPSDLGSSDIAAEQGERSLAGEIELALEPGMDGAEELAQPGDAARLVVSKFAAAHDLQAQCDDGVVVWQDWPQGPGADKVGDGVCVARVRHLRSPPAKPCPARLTAMPGTWTRRRPGPAPGGWPPGNSDPVMSRPITTALSRPRRVGDETIDRGLIILDRPVEKNPGGVIESADPVRLLGDVYSNEYLHGGPLKAWRQRSPGLADIALHSHRGHRAISSRSRSAKRAAQQPEPSRTVGMTTIPASPAPTQLAAINGASKRGTAK